MRAVAVVDALGEQPVGGDAEVVVGGDLEAEAGLVGGMVVDRMPHQVAGRLGEGERHAPVAIPAPEVEAGEARRPPRDAAVVDLDHEPAAGRQGSGGGDRELGVGARDGCRDAVDTGGGDGVAGEVEVQRRQGDRGGGLDGGGAAQLAGVVVPGEIDDVAVDVVARRCRAAG